MDDKEASFRTVLERSRPKTSHELPIQDQRDALRGETDLLGESRRAPNTRHRNYGLQDEVPALKQTVLAYRAANALEAHLIKHVLEAREIPVEIVGEGLAGAVGELPVDVLQVEVRTLPEFAEQARAAIQDYQQDEPGPEEPAWRCPFCDEENAPNFEICWRCEKERPPFS